MEKGRTIKTEAELQGVAAKLLGALTPPSGAEGGGAVVLALHGDLGAGKTTFVQQLGRELGVAEQITSPTFVIMKHYATDSPAFQRLTHIDAYRIEKVNEMEVLGFSELLTDARRLICIEWAERIEPLLPQSTVHLTFTLHDSGARTLMLAGIDKW